MRLISWNVNGIRAVQRKDVMGVMHFSDWVVSSDADVICVQETKAQREQLNGDLIDIDGYELHMNSAKRKGYSGVAMYTRDGPNEVIDGIGSPEFDDEGRVQIARFDGFTLMNVYFPNGKASEERLDFKMRFYEEFLDMTVRMRGDGERLIVCGDVNTAHREIDLARPKPNEGRSGFLPIERDWVDRFLDSGFVDSFREFDDSPEMYTWWDLKTRSRERNVGWRIDYFFVDGALRDSMVGAGIMGDVMGSDHCPICLDIDV